MNREVSIKVLSDPCEDKIVSMHNMLLATVVTTEQPTRHTVWIKECRQKKKKTFVRCDNVFTQNCEKVKCEIVQK